MRTVLLAILEGVLLILTVVYHTLMGILLAITPSALKPKKDVTGEIALITGGGSGIGRLLALKLSSLGCNIVLWDVNTAGNEETVELIRALGGTASGYTVDVTDRSAVMSAAEEVSRDVGDVSMLINNAGVVTGHDVMDLTLKDIQFTLNVNFIAHYWTLQAFLPAMRKNNHGHIVTVASLCGVFGLNKLSDYCASKFAAIGLHESVRAEVKRDGLDGVKFTLVCPSVVSTGLFDGFTSRVMPMLKPDEVVDEITTAVLTDYEVLLIPKYSALLVVIKWAFPHKAIDAIATAFGTYTCMDTFTGRAEKTEKVQ